MCWEWGFNTARVPMSSQRCPELKSQNGNHLHHLQCQSVQVRAHSYHSGQNLTVHTCCRSQGIVWAVNRLFYLSPKEQVTVFWLPSWRKGDECGGGENAADPRQSNNMTKMSNISMEELGQWSFVQEMGCYKQGSMKCWRVWKTLWAADNISRMDDTEMNICRCLVTSSHPLSHPTVFWQCSIPAV